MQPSADAFPGRTERVDGRTERVEPESAPPSVGVPPPRSAPEVESTPAPAAPADLPGVEAAGAVRPEKPTGAGAAELPDADATGLTGSDATGLPDSDATGPTGSDASGLTERERRILAFERHWWRHAGAKEQAIRDTFALSATRYYQLLNALLDNPAALAAEPLLIGRLRRLRSSRARNRRR